MSAPFPAIYHGPDQRPLPWLMDDAELRPAVEAFLSVEAGPEQCALVYAYLVYHIHAPFFLPRTFPPDLMYLRDTSLKVGNVRDAWAYLADCIALGIDPL